MKPPHENMVVATPLTEAQLLACMTHADQLDCLLLSGKLARELPQLSWWDWAGGSITKQWLDAGYAVYSDQPSTADYCRIWRRPLIGSLHLERMQERWLS